MSGWFLLRKTRSCTRCGHFRGWLRSLQFLNLRGKSKRLEDEVDEIRALTAPVSPKPFAAGVGVLVPADALGIERFIHVLDRAICAWYTVKSNPFDEPPNFNFNQDTLVLHDQGSLYVCCCQTRGTRPDHNHAGPLV